MAPRPACRPPPRPGCGGVRGAPLRPSSRRMSLQFEHSLFMAHERLLWMFAEVEPLAQGLTGMQLICDGKRFCRRLTFAFGAWLAASLVVVCMLHATHVGNPGCFGAVAEAAARFWSNGANSSSDFFRQDDVFRISVDYKGASPSAVLWGPNTSAPSTAPSVVLEVWPPGGPAPAAPLAGDYVFSAADPLVLAELGGGYSGASLRAYSARGGAVTAGSRGGAALLEAHSIRHVDLVLPLRCGRVGGPSGATAFAFALRFADYDTVIINELIYALPWSPGYIANTKTYEVWNWPALAAAGGGGSGRFFFALDALLAFFLLSSLAAAVLRILLTSGVACVYPAARCLASSCARRGRLGAWRAAAATREVDRALNAAYPWLGAHVSFARRVAAVDAAEGEGDEGLVPAEAAGGAVPPPVAGAPHPAGDAQAQAGEQQQRQQQQQQQQPPPPPPPPPPAAVVAPPPPHATPFDALASSFIWAHILAALVLFLALYVGGGTLTSVVLTGWKSQPASLVSDVWGVFLIAEMLCLFFMRTEASLFLFPRLCLAAFLAWCVYFCAVPYGFFSEVTSLWLIFVMLSFTVAVRALEVPALREGRIHFLRPRAQMACLPAPQPVAPASGILPNLYTVWLPLNVWLPEPEPLPADGVYGIPVPPLEGEAAGDAP